MAQRLGGLTRCSLWSYCGLLLSKQLSSICVQSAAGWGIQHSGRARQVEEKGHEVGAKAWSGWPPGPAGAGGGEVQQILASLGLHLWFPLGECTLITGREGLLWFTGKPPQESSHASPHHPVLHFTCTSGGCAFCPVSHFFCDLGTGYAGG